ncbi:DNA cytosine methyltransferase [Aquibacillus saliphilus]|uniref:DNA cytosine methyltransferase n=1 Tax=Aquibacillus saliphilus TaxID=1909422 RepID=UPI001CEFFBC2|nr:DNA cytosine methyltransferase [Aquibacillus saliphilus]
MNILSLFDGISCGRVAVDRANIQVDNYYASEIEKPAIESTMRNFPDTVQLGDINQLNEDFLGTLPKIDIVMGGSPCQGFSRNGKGLNFDDPRSQLLLKFIDILNWIKENNNPNVNFLLENVVMKQEWQDVVTERIGVNPTNINSFLVSAQKRPRLYWTNIEVSQPIDNNINLIDILEDNVSDDYIISEELMKSKPIEIKGNMIDRFITMDGNQVIVRNATKQGYLIAEEGDSINLSVPNSNTRRGRVGKGKSNTLDTQCNQAVFIDGKIRRLTLTELERLQTLPDGFTEGLSNSSRKKAIGNGWTVDVIAHILKGIR